MGDARRLFPWCGKVDRDAPEKTELARVCQKFDLVSPHLLSNFSPLRRLPAILGVQEEDRSDDEE